ncbi:MAG: hypothetical protein G01um101470_1066 [Parcubacteria group bacterium Gr01-1014_70]|nr:MAG: hypothetical protein G01um101470_1066 [Parcubacteria group bacterium Gr01-1014_70]
MDILSKIKGKEDIRELLTQLTPDETYWMLPGELTLAYACRRATCLYFYFTDLLLERTGLRQVVKELQARGIATTPEVLATAKFVSAYSQFVMASSIVKQCEKMLAMKAGVELAHADCGKLELVLGKGVANDIRYLYSTYADILTDTYTKEGVKLVQTVNDEFSVSCDFWKAVAAKAAEAVKVSPKLLALVENTTFQLGSFSITGLSAEKQKEAQVVVFKPVLPEEVVGDPETTITMLRASSRVCLYDPVRQMNPLNEFGGLIESILIDGPPGTGKTTRFRMMMTDMKNRAERRGMPYLFKSVSAEQVKNEFYGKTAALMAEVLLAVRDPRVLALLCFDDIDLLIAGDRDAAGSNGADKDIMSAIMNFFSGTGTNYIGNYIGVAATNKPTGADDALRQRFVYRAKVAGPNTVEEYTDLVALELRSFVKTGLLKIGEGGYKPLSRAIPKTLSEIYSQELTQKYAKKVRATWEDIGAFCIELHRKDPKFTGRPVKNAIQVAKAQAADFDVPEEWYDKPGEFLEKPWEDRVSMVRELYHELTPDKVMMALEHQFESEHRYAAEAETKRIQDRAYEIRIHEAAVKLASTS